MCVRSTLIYCKPIEVNELVFEKGDIINVMNREYKDWWGQLKLLKSGTGIFPVDSVRLCANLQVYLCLCLCSRGVQEPLPEPTPAELTAEGQQEAAMFSQVADDIDC